MKRLLSIFAALCGVLVAPAEQLSVEAPVLVASSSAAIEIALSNEHADLVAFQMDLTLPEGVGIDKAGCALSSRIMDEEQVLTIGRIESNTYRVTSTSFSLTPISGTGGTLVTLKLASTADFVSGQATISNILFSTASSQAVKLSDVSFAINTLYTLTYLVDGKIYKTSSVAYGTAITPEAAPTKDGYIFSGWSEIPETMPAHDVVVTGRFYLYGDVNGNDGVDIGDAVSIVNYLVGKESSSFVEKTADTNHNGQIDIGDAVTIVNFLVGKTDSLSPQAVKAWDEKEPQ
ncbi:MAG: InlB B-repeat-containing protein [Bacteroidaceae bacterium]|nr:InlB B-repeat-containing protein [Bacteroidaceae bacterium]